MATILQIVNRVQDQLGISRSSAIVSASDSGARQFYGLLLELGDDLKKEIAWPQLTREYMFPLVAYGAYTGDTVADVASITNLSDTTGIAGGQLVTGEGWNGIGAAANSVRVLSISGSTVATSLAANEATTTEDYYFSQDRYALPEDFDEAINRTHWDRYNRWELVGPLTPQHWQFYKSGLIAQTPRRRFRVSGMQDNKFTINPPPGTAEAGQYLAFEYQSLNWIRPPLWAAVTSFGANSYCFNDGNFYTTTSGGTTGSTPPTHLSGSVSDGGVTWAYFAGSYVEVIDTDNAETLIDDKLMVLGLKYYWRKEKRLYHDDLKQEFEDKVATYASSLRGSPTINMRPSGFPPWLIGRWSIPDTGYGQ